MAMLLFILILFSILLQTRHQKEMKFSIKDYFSECDQVRRRLQVSSHLLDKSLTESFMFCAVKWCRIINGTEKWEHWNKIGYLICKKFVGKKWRIFALLKNIFYRRNFLPTNFLPTDFFLPTNNFYRRIIFTDKLVFLFGQYFAFCCLKIP